jgi:hypothetical protein
MYVVRSGQVDALMNTRPDRPLSFAATHQQKLIGERAMSTMQQGGDTALPVAVIGAGPVGLAAAAHLVARGMTPVVLEAGDTVGASIRRWSHVRLFSPWKYLVDPAARTMLQASGWTEPDGEVLPTGGELVARYLEPLAALPQLAPHLRTGHRVVAVSRRGYDMVKSAGREQAPFELVVRTAEGRTERLLARAVIDASGTYEAPNPIGASGLPVEGEAAGELLASTATQLFDHSLFNGHPRFFGYITSSPAPIGMFSDFLAAALNQNVGAWSLSPLATEIECQAVRWMAELIGFPPGCGGLFVSGGNMANFVGVLAARAAAAGWDVRAEGLSRGSLVLYASTETHTWIQKAADLFGFGTNAIRWIPADAHQRDRTAFDVLR